jgi:uncharacterized protein
MEAAEIAGVVSLAFAAGLAGGGLGVGGGVLFVPALVLFMGLSQLEAEATSLLAIVPVALVGAWRQRSYENVRMREGLLIGALCLPGVLAGTAAANVAPERLLELAFAAVQLYFAVGLARRALKRGRDEDPESV